MRGADTPAAHASISCSLAGEDFSTWLVSTEACEESSASAHADSERILEKLAALRPEVEGLTTSLESAGRDAPFAGNARDRLSPGG